jgi:hypothetical protein
MCWGISPDVNMGAPSPQPVISRELLRSVCEPFFEQMLTALQQTLQETQRQQYAGSLAIDTTSQMTKSAYFQPGSHMHTQQFTYLNPMIDEESTEADDVGAFASLLSGPSSESEGFDGVEAQTPEAMVAQPPVASQALPEDSEQVSDSEKSTMVCRHWKTKGWCRLEANCKFLHPEHKRGIAAPQGCSSGSTNVGDMSKAACPGMSTTCGLPGDVPSVVALPHRRKRGGRNRSSKGAQGAFPGLDMETTELPRHMGESSFFTFQGA